MRSRNIKPGFFKNELLGTEDPFVSLTFAGLWCIADREGILEDRPIRIKAEIFPYRENFDINRYLTVLERLKFILRYEVNGNKYIKVVNFEKHQHPHKTEKASEYPHPPTTQLGKKKQDITNNGAITVIQPLSNGYNPPDSLIPVLILRIMFKKKEVIVFEKN